MSSLKTYGKGYETSRKLSKSNSSYKTVNIVYYYKDIYVAVFCATQLSSKYCTDFAVFKVLNNLVLKTL